MTLVQQVFDLLSAYGLKICTAESCTGGMVAAALTDIAGSSNVFDRGFVTYSNASKVEQLGVPDDLIARFGAVSEEVVMAMARGALLHSAANFSIAITGIAGPGGGSIEKPVGLVWFALASQENMVTQAQQFGPLSRSAIRARAVEFAFEMTRDHITQSHKGFVRAPQKPA